MKKQILKCYGKKKAGEYAKCGSCEYRKSCITAKDITAQEQQGESEWNWRRSREEFLDMDLKSNPDDSLLEKIDAVLDDEDSLKSKELAEVIRIIVMLAEIGRASCRERV